MNEHNERMRIIRNEIEACDFMAEVYTKRKEKLQKELNEMVEQCKSKI